MSCPELSPEDAQIISKRRAYGQARRFHWSFTIFRFPSRLSKRTRAFSPPRARFVACAAEHAARRTGIEPYCTRTLWTLLCDLNKTLSSRFERNYAIIPHVGSPWLVFWHVALYYTRQVEPTFRLFHFGKRILSNRIRLMPRFMGQNCGYSRAVAPCNRSLYSMVMFWPCRSVDV